ncbi:MAG: hypothetical protein O9325_02725, partial [Roseomonas sp.]|nr:hypothetical protein [Roseomonas sp.]
MTLACVPSRAEAQAPSGPMLAPPALPPTLPGGVPVPSLPAATQQEILQRILDTAGGRGSPPPPSSAPQPWA